MADSCYLIKVLFIKAEDDRIVGDMKLMKCFYANLFARWLGSTPSGPTTTRSC